MFLSLDKSYSEEEEKKPNNINRCLGHQPKHLKTTRQRTDFEADR